MKTTVAVLVIFKEYFTILTHYCGFGSLAPHSNELPVVVLTEEISEDLHVVPVDGSNIPDSLNPPS